MTVARQHERAQGVPDEINLSDLARTMGRTQKVAPAASGGASFASSAQLGSLAAYLNQLTTIATETGWHTPTMVVSSGDDDEAIVVGVRWINGAYYAEIR